MDSRPPVGPAARKVTGSMSERTQSSRARCPSPWSCSGPPGTWPHASSCPPWPSLAGEGSLPEGFGLIGVARSTWSDEEFRDHCLEAAPTRSRRGTELVKGFRYVQRRLRRRRHFRPDRRRCSPTLDAQSNGGRGTGGNRLFYLATIPALFGEVAQGARPARAQQAGRRAAASPAS